jgi:Tetratricopeptide repeat
VRAGQYSKAEPLLKRALAVIEEARGPHHSDVSAALENYAVLLRKTKRLSEAEKLEERAMSIRKARP